MLTFGADPEFFVIKDNKFIPPQHLRNEGKVKVIGEYKGYEVVFDNGDVLVHIDGPAFEFVLKSPKKSLVDVAISLRRAIRVFQNYYGIELAPIPAVKIDLSEFNLSKDDLFSLNFAGCNPDFDPTIPFTTETQRGMFKFRDNFRYGGGHITISGPFFIKDKIAKDHINIAKRFAVIVGPTIVVLTDNFIDLERKRSKVYGTPGKYRPKKAEKYGLFEYRMPSNQWVFFDERSILEIESSIRRALLEEIDPGPLLEDSVKAILNFDKNLAIKVIGG